MSKGGRNGSVAAISGGVMQKYLMPPHTDGFSIAC